MVSGASSSSRAELVMVAPRRRYPSPVVKQELAKLGSKQAESRRSALLSLRTVVEEHLQSGGALQRFVQQVEESEDGRRNAAGIVSELARVHGPRLEPLFHRLLAILLHTMLASAAQTALQAECARAVEALATHAALTEDALRRLCLPLMALLPHKVQPLSAGAAACLAALVDSPPWRRLAPPSSSLVSELCVAAAAALPSPSAHTVPHLSLLRSLAASNAASLAPFAAPLLRLLPSILLPPTPSSWQLRVAALRLLHALLPLPDPTALSPILRPSLLSLAACRLDKMPHVRNAAIDALRTAHSLAASHIDDLLFLKPPSPRSCSGSISRRRSPAARSTTLPDSALRRSFDSNSASRRNSLHKRRSSPTKPSLPPLLQHSHLLDSALSPRAPLSTLNAAASSGSSLRASDRASSQPISGTDTPSSTSRRTVAADDDSDYFCAYFLYDNKDKISCRKIVHHIHDSPAATATNSTAEASAAATPPGSPTSKVSSTYGGKLVPPLPLSKMQKAFGASNGGYKKDSDLSCCDDEELQYTPPSSVTRQVRVLQSHEELLASCGVQFPSLPHFSSSRDNVPSSVEEAADGAHLLPDIMTRIVEADERDYGAAPAPQGHGVLGVEDDHYDDAPGYSARSSPSSPSSRCSDDDQMRIHFNIHGSSTDSNYVRKATYAVEPQIVPPSSSKELPITDASLPSRMTIIEDAEVARGMPSPTASARGPHRDDHQQSLQATTAAGCSSETAAAETDLVTCEGAEAKDPEENKLHSNENEGANSRAAHDLEQKVAGLKGRGDHHVVQEAAVASSSQETAVEEAEADALASSAAGAAEWSVRDNPIAVDAQTAAEHRKVRQQSKKGGGVLETAEVKTQNETRDGMEGGIDQDVVAMDVERRRWRWRGGAVARVVFSSAASTAVLAFTVAKLLQPLYSHNAMPPT